MTRHVCLVAGTRPNFIKVAPVHRALTAHGDFRLTLVHTGQHYDREMSDLLFEQLAIPRPDLNLDVGSGSHAEQTAAIMTRFEALLVDRKPDLVLVVGDVNSTVACALAAKKLPGIGVAHVEAGLRSGDRTMPEEINRVLTDAIADLHFTTEPSGGKHLRREGVAEKYIHHVGNVMIDTLRAHLTRARETNAVGALGLKSKGYALVTLHRPVTVDDQSTLNRVMDVIADIAADLPVVFPVHPRSRDAVDRWRDGRAAAAVGLRLVAPAGYLEFLHLMAEARLVLTDSGGIQEETTALGVPCLTLRDTTERPITVDVGTNLIVGLDPARIASEATRVLEGGPTNAAVPELWDGHAAERIAKILGEWNGELRQG